MRIFFVFPTADEVSSILFTREREREKGRGVYFEHNFFNDRIHSSMVKTNNPDNLVSLL
jgi:hypothetical protein